MWQGCPISLFLFNSTIDTMLRTVINTEDSEPTLHSDNWPIDLDYADDIAVITWNESTLQRAINGMMIKASRFSIYVSPTKCKVLLQDWHRMCPTINISSSALKISNSSVYLGSFIDANSGIHQEVDNRIVKAGTAVVNIRHPWGRPDICPALKGCVYNLSRFMGVRLRHSVLRNLRN